MSLLRTILPPIRRGQEETTAPPITPSQGQELNRYAVPVLVTHERARLNKPHDHAKHVAPTMLYTWLVEHRVTEYTTQIQTYSDWETKYYNSNSDCPCPWSAELYHDLTNRLSTSDSIEDPIIEYTKYDSFHAFKVTEQTREYIQKCFSNSTVQHSHVKSLLRNNLFNEYNPETPVTALTQLKVNSTPLP